MGQHAWILGEDDLAGSEDAIISGEGSLGAIGVNWLLERKQWVFLVPIESNI